MLPARFVGYRRWERVPVDMNVELFVGTQLLGREARALDLSWTGARIQADGFALSPSDAVDVVLVGSNIWQRRTAKVVWVESARSRNGFEAGLRFLRPLASED